MNRGFTVDRPFHVDRGQRGRRQFHEGEADVPPVPGRVPRVAKLMALAIRFDQSVSDGVVANFAELARLGRVTRTRLSQIMNLLNLAPDIQEDLLFRTPPDGGRETVTEKSLRSITAEAEWRKQRRMWSRLTGRSHANAKTG